MTALDQDASRLDLWYEFAESTLELARNSNLSDSGQGQEYLMESAIVAGAIYEHDKEQPPKKWRELGKAVAGEVGRQVNQLVSAMNSQAGVAGNFDEFMKGPGGISDTTGTRPPNDEAIRGRKQIEGYRRDARVMVAQSVVYRQLLEALPEQSSGMISLLSGQLESAQNSWVAALGLDAGYVLPVQADAKHSLEVALLHARSDLNDLGYFLPKTILENGVLQ
jgi:hypothetical protein